MPSIRVGRRVTKPTFKVAYGVMEPSGVGVRGAARHVTVSVRAVEREGMFIRRERLAHAARLGMGNPKRYSLTRPMRVLRLANCHVRARARHRRGGAHRQSAQQRRNPDRLKHPLRGAWVVIARLLL